MINAYAAGILDGEGCITIAHGNMTSFSARIDIGMTVKGIACLQRIQSEFGGSIRLQKKNNAKWADACALGIFGAATVPFLEAILPYLALKNRQAEYALAVQRIVAELPRARKGVAQWTPEAIEKCKAIRLLVQELNRKGPEAQEPEGNWFARLVAGKWITRQRDLFSDLQWEEFSETWPRAGMMRNGIVYQQEPLDQSIKETGFLSLPTIVKNESKGSARNRYIGSIHFRGAKMSEGLRICESDPIYLNPCFAEAVMGFPIGWTDLQD